MRNHSACLQVSSNGLLSFDRPFLKPFPHTFPLTTARVVAPYWDDSDTRVKGFARYDIVTNSHPSLSCLISITSDVISSLENTTFQASWLLVTRWVDLCPYLDRNCQRLVEQFGIVLVSGCHSTLQENNFQVVLATDGLISYAVFTYKCGELNWVQHDASIGFSASKTLFANHPLSMQDNVTAIACLNKTCAPWNNVVFQTSLQQGKF